MMVSWRPATSAPKSRLMAGSATFTTVASRKARLEPSTVASRIQRPAVVPNGTPPGSSARAATATASGLDRGEGDDRAGARRQLVDPGAAVGEAQHASVGQSREQQAAAVRGQRVGHGIEL